MFESASNKVYLKSFDNQIRHQIGLLVHKQRLLLQRYAASKFILTCMVSNSLHRSVSILRTDGQIFLSTDLFNFEIRPVIPRLKLKLRNKSLVNQNWNWPNSLN